MSILSGQRVGQPCQGLVKLIQVRPIAKVVGYAYLREPVTSSEMFTCPWWGFANTGVLPHYAQTLALFYRVQAESFNLLEACETAVSARFFIRFGSMRISLGITFAVITLRQMGYLPIDDIILGIPKLVDLAVTETVGALYPRYSWGTTSPHPFYCTSAKLLPLLLEQYVSEVSHGGCGVWAQTAFVQPQPGPAPLEAGQ